MTILFDGHGFKGFPPGKKKDGFWSRVLGWFTISRTPFPVLERLDELKSKLETLVSTNETSQGTTIERGHDSKSSNGTD